MPRFDLVYHLVSPHRRARVRLKVRINAQEAIETLSTLYPGAGWPERELYDLFGIVFDGHADLRRLMMPEDWEGHPLRKDYPVQLRKDAQTYMPLQVTEEEFKANMERDRFQRRLGEADDSVWPTTARAAHVVRALKDAAAAHERMAASAAAVVEAAGAIAAALKQGRTVFAFGNGGSAADAQHFAAELVGRYERERKAWPAIALTTDTSALTAIGNDLRLRPGVRAADRGARPARRRRDRHHARAATRRTCCAALEAANERGLVTIALTGRGGEAGTIAAHPRRRSTKSGRARVQEVHATRVACDL